MSFPVIPATLSLILIVASFSISAHAEELIGEFPDPTKDLVNNVIQYVDGEQFNALTGEMGYYLTDFSIEGNGPTIELGRKFRREHGYPYAFDTMSLEMPRIEYYHLGKLTYAIVGADAQDPNYRLPATGVDQCAGLKMYGLGTLIPPNDNDDSDKWEYGRSDLNSGIRLFIRGKPISFFPTDSILNTTRFPATADYISPNNWYIDCAGTQWVVKSPDGMTYRFDQYEHVYAGETWAGQKLDTNHYMDQAKVTVYPSRVEDTYGNTLTYSYDSMPAETTFYAQSNRAFTKRLLKTISANDGRTVSLTYNGGKVTRITDNSIPNPRTLSFTYRTLGSNKGLEKVIRSDGSYWEYHYTRSVDNVLDFRRSQSVGISLTKIKTPADLSIDYYQLGHSTIFHTDPGVISVFGGVFGDFSAGYLESYIERPIVYGLIPYGYTALRAGLRQRTLSGPEIPAGMTWRYDYFKLGVSNKAVTYISGPTANQKLTFRRLDYYHSPLVAYPDSGRLLEKAIYPAGTSFTASGAAVPLKKNCY